MSKLELVAHEIRSLNSREQRTLLSRLPRLLKVRIAERPRLSDHEITKLAEMSKKTRATGRGS